MKKTLLILGASSDIGMETIEQISDNYEFIIAHYNHMNDRLKSIVQNNGTKIIPVQCDLTDIEAVHSMISTIRDKGYMPDHIIHFPAPQIKIRKFHKTKWDVFDNAINISIRSLIIVLREFIPDMIKNQNGKIVVMLSMVVNNMPPKHNSDYVMTKYALLGLVRSLAVEYAEYGITVNAISPAMVETKFIEGLHELIINDNANQSPKGRNLNVNEVVPTIQYLLSDGADCINGQNILITNGI